MNLLKTVTTELKCIPQAVGVTIESAPGLLAADGEDFQRVSNSKGDRYWIPWTEELGAWVSQAGHEVVLVVSDECDRSQLAGALTTGLASVIAGACLNLQGQVAIHANAVAIEGQAVAFVGYSGRGKSTLSAYCASQGAKLITDDVLVVDPQGFVHPGNPRVKLYPETAEQLGLEAIAETDYKIYYHPTQLGSALLQQPIAIGVLYLLAENEDDSRVYSEPLSPSQAVFELLTHSYYANNLIPSNPALLDAYVRLVTQTAVRKLVYPRCFSDLPKVYDFLLAEIRQ